MNFTTQMVKLMFTVIQTFTDIYNFFLTDLGESTGLVLLDGITIIEAMLGTGLTIVLTYTLIKWVSGVIT